MEKEALRVVHTQLFHRLELFLPLHPFSNDLRPLAIREVDHGLDQVLLQEVRVDVRNQRDVQLDVVGRQVRDGSEAGAMDYLASRIRERADLPVMPSDQAIVYVAGQDEAAFADPSRRWQLAQAAGVDRLLAPSAKRTAVGWHVRLEVQEAERQAHFDGMASTPLAAADLALEAWLDTLGMGGTLAPAPHSPLLELQQRIDTAFLEGDLAAATELIEAAPPELQREPAIAVRAAEVDERSGRSELARKQFARIAEGGEGVTPALRGRALYGLCAIGFRRNELEAAARRCADALEALAGQSDSIARGRAYMMSAVIDDHLGNLDAALAGFGRARIEWQRAGNAPGEASVDANEGLALAHHGRHA